MSTKMEQPKGEDVSSSSLGLLWYSHFYQSIGESLQLSEEKDLESRNILSKLLVRKKSVFDLAVLRSTIRSKKCVVVFGAGPSLEDDLAGLKQFLGKARPFVAASDGAADALCEQGIVVDLLVSDLDSCSKKVLHSQSGKSNGLVTHSHGDNIQLLSELVPQLGRNMLGTTQVLPLADVPNLGGFTDGDRTCYIVASARPSTVVIAGMDFGVIEGEYSKSKRPGSSTFQRLRRDKKLEWGKRGLEFLIGRCPDIAFLNVTKRGVPIAGAAKIDYGLLSSRAS